MKPELLRDFVFRQGRNIPKKTAYICGERSITWEEIDRRSNDAVAAFQSLGLGAGDSLGILAPETLEVYEHFFACFKMGAIRTGINRRFSAREVLHLVKDAQVKMIVVHSDYVDMIAGIRAELDAAGVILVGYGEAHGFEYEYEELLANTVSEPMFPEIDPESPAMYTYTSGTTGNPKGVVLPDRSIRKVIEMSPGNFGFSPDDVFYCPLANSWAAVITNLLCLSNGMTYVIPDKEYNTVAFLKDVERLQITAFLLAPTMLQWVLDELDKSDYDVSSLRLAMYGSAPAVPKLISEVSERLGCGLLQGYGTSESAAGWIAKLTPADHVRGLSEKPALLRSAGRVPSYFDISIRDEDGIEVPCGEVGEVWVRSETIMTGYLNLPDATEEVMKDDGWLITNDMGALDEEGYLYLKDRRKFMIVSGGINVFPSGVEAVMSDHPAILEIAIVGVPHPTWGEAVVGVVHLAEGRTATAEELIRFCDGKLSKVMLPKHIHFIDAPLPKLSNLKVDKPRIMGWFRDNPQLLPDSFRG